MNITIHRYTILKSALLLAFVILPLLGSDCNNTSTQNSGNISGTWQLNFVQGNLQDVCFGETVTFPSNTGGTATLTCPEQSPVSEDYTFSSDVLTYTQTGVTYSVNSSSSTLLILTGTFTSNGVNSTRILTYEKVSADRKQTITAPPGKNNVNSSQKFLSN